jgi:type II secretion system protein N
MIMAAINRRTLLTVSAYAAFFMLCFVAFAHWTFPYERLRDTIVARVAAANTGSGPTNKLTIGELGPHWLTGVALSSVKMERTPVSSDELPTRITLDELTLHAAPLRFLLGGIGVDYDATVGAGEIDGSYRQSRDGPHQVESKLDAVDLGKLGLGSVLGIPMQGIADGAIEVQLAEKPTDTHGTVQLHIKQLRLGDGKAKVKIPGMGGGLTLDPIDAGNTDLKLSIRDGVATVERLEAKGKDLSLTGSGSVRLARSLPLSRIDLTIEVKFDKGYTERSERTKAAFELMAASPVIQRAQSPDGTMRFRVSGTLASPRSSPAAPSGQRSRAD